MSHDAGIAHLDTYLAQVQRHLGGLPDAEVRETLAELRSHVLDKVAGDLSVRAIEGAIAALGTPLEVARLNVTERVAAELDTNRSPFRVLRGMVRLASLSVYGAFALLVSFTGYSTAAAFIVTAAVKPFNPSHTGMWITAPGVHPMALFSRHQHRSAGARAIGLVDHPAWPAGGSVLRLADLALRPVQRAADAPPERGGRA